MADHRIGVGSAELVYLVPTRVLKDIVLLVEEGLVGKGDVGAGEGLPVGPGDAMAQMEGPGEAIGCM